MWLRVLLLAGAFFVMHRLHSTLKAWNSGAGGHGRTQQKMVAAIQKMSRYTTWLWQLTALNDLWAESCCRQGKVVSCVEYMEGDCSRDEGAAAEDERRIEANGAEGAVWGVEHVAGNCCRCKARGCSIEKSADEDDQQSSNCRCLPPVHMHHMHA